MNISMTSASFSLLHQQSGPAGMLKSTREKLERQQNMHAKIEFFEAQKENLKKIECDSLEDIAGKLERLHSYNDQIAAAKQEYNNSQMFHILDEAKEGGERIAKEAEKKKPKTKEERKEELAEEALGTEEEKGVLTEMTEKLSEIIEDMVEQSGDVIEQPVDMTEVLEAEMTAIVEDNLKTEEYTALRSKGISKERFFDIYC